MKINVDSQSKQRQIAKKWTGEDIAVEMINFQFPKDKKGKFSFEDAPWGYLIDVVTHILYYLDALTE